MMIQQASSWHSPTPKPIKVLTGALALLSGVRPTAARLGSSCHQDMVQAPGAEHLDATPGYCQLPHSSHPIQEKQFVCTPGQEPLQQEESTTTHRHFDSIYTLLPAIAGIGYMHYDLAQKLANIDPQLFNSHASRPLQAATLLAISEYSLGFALNYEGPKNTEGWMQSILGASILGLACITALNLGLKNRNINAGTRQTITEATTRLITLFSGTHTLQSPRLGSYFIGSGPYINGTVLEQNRVGTVAVGCIISTAYLIKACAKLQKSMSQHQAASRVNQTTQTTATP